MIDASTMAIAQFQGLRVPQYELFLKERLSLTAEADLRRRDRHCNFEPWGIPFGESHLDSLTKLFRKLPADTQERFRNGLVDTFRHATQAEFSADGISGLIYLIGMTKSPAGLESFCVVLGSGSWGKAHPELFYDALSALYMFPSSTATYRGVRSLATSGCFPDKFVFDACAIMVRSSPLRWLDDLRDLSVRFDRLIERIDRSNSDAERNSLAEKERKLARSLKQYVPLADIARALERLDPTRSMEGRLLRRLLGQSGTLTLEGSEDDQYHIVDRADPGRRTRASLGPQVLLAALKWRLIRRSHPGWPSAGMQDHIVAAALRRLASVEGARPTEAPPLAEAT